MIVLKTTAILKARNRAYGLKMYCFDLELPNGVKNMVHLTASFPDYPEIGVTASWSDLWNCLFLPRGKSKSFEESALDRIIHPKNNWRKELLIFFPLAEKGRMVAVQWKDFRNALLSIKKIK